MKVKSIMMFAGLMFLLISAVFATAAPPDVATHDFGFVSFHGSDLIPSADLQFRDAELPPSWRMWDNPISRRVFLIGGSQLTGSISFNYYTVIKQC